MLIAMLVLWLGPADACAQNDAASPRRGGGRGREDGNGSAGPGYVPGPLAEFSCLVGRPSGTRATLSLLSAKSLDVRVEHGSDGAATLSQRLGPFTLNAGEPMEIELDHLTPSTCWRYRVVTGGDKGSSLRTLEDQTFQTSRSPGASFMFAVQGDSHPERPGKMYDPELYAKTLTAVAKDKPDFYFTMGDDFSIERLIERKTFTQPSVDAIYAHQRGFLGLVGRASPLFLVNGNHEQAAKYLLDGTPNNPAVLAGRARTRFYPLPPLNASDAFYSGNTQPVEHIGLVRDHFAWTWGDALFVVIDPYWHSEVAVDNEAGSRNKDGRDGKDAGGGGQSRRDLWKITLGDAQYQWLQKTLRSSDATYKFVFSHHVMGTGRGGVEVAGNYEWGGNDQRGTDRFFQMRPTWSQPIHDLMRDAGVTIFFQGHDHLYARQELEGVTYQTVPNPADPTYTAFNSQHYRSGDIRPNSGYLRVTVANENVQVQYVSMFLPKDEGKDRTSGSIAHEYALKPRPMVAPKPSQPNADAPASLNNRPDARRNRNDKDPRP